MTAPVPNILARAAYTRRHDTRGTQDFLDGLSLARGRVHEICGPARRTLAAAIAGKAQGPVFWISPGWITARLHSDGLQEFINPGRITFVSPGQSDDMLWSFEEVLRAGVVPIVVTDLPGTAGLTAVRRLHLAAEAGAKTSGHSGGLAPLGLLLTPSDQGSTGVETRWHMQGAHRGAQRSWHLSRLRARSDPPKSWEVRQDPVHLGGRLHRSEIEDQALAG